MKSVLLGIDIGSSKIAATIVDDHAKLIASASRQHLADISENGNHAEQDVKRLKDTIRMVILDLPEELRMRIGAIGVTGQAHGIALFDQSGENLSNLITWQDRRCLKDHLLQKIANKTGYRLYSGYGCATLYWLADKGLIPAEATYAATIQDDFVHYLCASDEIVIDPTIAASMGLFNLQTMTWDFAAMADLGIPHRLLPKLIECSSQAGTVQPQIGIEFGLPPETPVAVSLGDNQASLLATLTDPDRELALTIGTGGQISVVLPEGEDISPYLNSDDYEVRPYPGQRYAIVAAALCGGSAWLWLAKFVEQCLCSFTGEQLSREQIFLKINELGLNADGSLTIMPHFNGERHNPSLRGSIEGIDLNNFNLGNLAKGVARGILANLKEMMPAEILKGRERIICSGNTLRLNPLLQAMAEEVFQMPVQLSQDNEEAAIGAAINAKKIMRSHPEVFAMRSH